jgi:hypothetical protein
MFSWTKDTASGWLALVSIACKYWNTSLLENNTFHPRRWRSLKLPLVNVPVLSNAILFTHAMAFWYEIEIGGNLIGFKFYSK